MEAAGPSSQVGERVETEEEEERVSNRQDPAAALRCPCPCLHLFTWRPVAVPLHLSTSSPPGELRLGGGVRPCCSISGVMATATSAACSPLSASSGDSSSPFGCVPGLSGGGGGTGGGGLLGGGGESLSGAKRTRTSLASKGADGMPRWSSSGPLSSRAATTG